MIVLALDASLAACSVAVWSDDRLVAQRFEHMARGQSEALVPMLRDTMIAAGISFADLSALAVTVGPGGYTGVRIGLSAARGMALATGLPLLGITTFDAVARAVRDSERLDGLNIAVALETKRTDIYLQFFTRELVLLGEPLVLAPEKVLLPDGPVGVAGDAADRFISGLRDQDRARTRRVGTARLDQPDAAVVAHIACERLTVDPSLLDGPMPRPLYLRPPSVTLAPKRA